MMICPKCGSENFSNESECWQCRERIGIPLLKTLSDAELWKGWAKWLNVLDVIFSINVIIAIIVGLWVFVALASTDEFFIISIYFPAVVIGTILSAATWIAMKAWVQATLRIGDILLKSQNKVPAEEEGDHDDMPEV